MDERIIKAAEVAAAISGTYLLSKYMYEKGYKDGLERSLENDSVQDSDTSVEVMKEDKLDYYSDRIREELDSDKEYPEKVKRNMRELEKRLARASNSIPLMEMESVPIELSKEDRIILASVEQ